MRLRTMHCTRYLLVFAYPFEVAKEMPNRAVRESDCAARSDRFATTYFIACDDDETCRKKQLMI